jgi:two-component system, OmpR family, response regulator
MSRRVLIIEDDDTIATALTEYLRDDGFEAEHAPNGVEGLRLARLTPPDVAVVDLKMPMMDGQALLTAWVHDAALGAIPVVLTSASPALLDEVQGFQVRARLAKPFDLDVLRAVIDQAMAHPDRPPDTPTIPPV